MNDYAHRVKWLWSDLKFTYGVYCFDNVCDLIMRHGLRDGRARHAIDEASPLNSQTATTPESFAEARCLLQYYEDVRADGLKGLEKQIRQAARLCGENFSDENIRLLRELDDNVEPRDVGKNTRMSFMRFADRRSRQRKDAWVFKFFCMYKMLPYAARGMLRQGKEEGTCDFRKRCTAWKCCMEKTHEAFDFSYLSCVLYRYGLRGGDTCRYLEHRYPLEHTAADLCIDGMCAVKYEEFGEGMELMDLCQCIMKKWERLPERIKPKRGEDSKRSFLLTLREIVRDSNERYMRKDNKMLVEMMQTVVRAFV